MKARRRVDTMTQPHTHRHTITYANELTGKVTTISTPNLNDPAIIRLRRDLKERGFVEVRRN